VNDGPPRMTTREVCALARYSSSTLWKRIDAGLMPAPIDRGGAGYLFDRPAVLTALIMDKPNEPETPAVVVDPEAYRAALAREVRRRKGASWRDR
jgi:predicted DNA-binding transcriptional regulator AlpA